MEIYDTLEEYENIIHLLIKRNRQLVELAAQFCDVQGYEEELEDIEKRMGGTK